MEDNGPLKKSLASLLKRLGIERVVCVDDDTPPADLDRLLDQITPDTKIPQSLLKKLDDALGEDPKTRAEQLRLAWGKIGDPAKRREIIFELNEELEGLPDGATPFSLELKSLLAPVAVENISPADWEGSKTGGEYVLGSKALVLFDYDLHNAPGFSAEGGAILARNFLTAHADAYCGIATHHAHNSAEAEQLELSIDTAGEKEREHLFVIAKESISKAPDEFAIRLKRLILRPSADQLRNAAIKALTKAHSEAMSAFGKIDVLQLSDLVHSAHEDGAWEMDSLRRVYNVEFRDALRVAERGIGMAAAANEVFNVRRALPKFPGIGDENARFQSRERYESGTSINAAYLPVQLGDVFVDEEATEYLLLAQACDILLRPRGTRTTSFGFMVPIVQTEPQANASETVFVLEWFFNDANDIPRVPGYVSFKKAFPIPLFVLDLAAYRADGNCRLGKDDSAPAELHEAAAKRFGDIYKTVSELAEKLSDGSSLELLGPPNGCPELPGRITNTPPWILRYPCRRTRRIALPYAIAVLTKYAQFLARTAFERPIEGS